MILKALARFGVSSQCVYKGSFRVEDNTRPNSTDRSTQLRTIRDVLTDKRDITLFVVIIAVVNTHDVKAATEHWMVLL